MSELVPWDKFEREYSQQFCSNNGSPSLSFRVALGSILIQQLLKTTDRETVKQIGENPYLQYFLGYGSFEEGARFDASMMTHFRKRLSTELLSQLNELIVSQGGQEISKQEKEHSGKLVLDATCFESDIRYPTDVSLLDESRRRLERVIDTLYKQASSQLEKKPRTYRKVARKKFTLFCFKKNPGGKSVRRAKREQLQYVKRNLSSINTLLDSGATLSELSRKLYRDYLVIGELYRQQQHMYDQRVRRVDDRIVSISQPHIRPIVRKKAGKPVEFGAKVSASYVEGFVFIDRVSFDAYNESADLEQQVEAFKKRHDFYPESVHVDAIYRTRANRKYCKKHGIRLSGRPLGRPKKTGEKERKAQQKSDARYRSRIEGVFGNTKRRLSVNRILTKLSETTTTVILMASIAFNLLKIHGTF